MTDRLTHLILKRTHMRPDATLGELQTEAGERICYTLEEPWRDNKRRVSCIPPGTYPWAPKPHRSQKRWILSGVPGRDGIEIHIGNSLLDTEGCILVGNSRSFWNSQPVVLGSERAITKLSLLLADTGTIEVRNPDARKK